MVTNKDPIQWWICTYKIPAEPSRYRVAIWRRLKEVGSIYLQNSICILPDTLKNEEFLHSIDHEIKSYDGDSFLLKSVFISKEMEKKIVDRFNAERENEYDELINHCQALMDEIEREKRRNNYTFGELDENEDELKRLFLWFEKIEKRDFFNSIGLEKAKQTLSNCKELLQHFSEQVIRFEEGS